MKKLLILQLLILLFLLACSNNEQRKKINIDVQYDGEKIVLKQEQFYKVELLHFIIYMDETTCLFPIDNSWDDLFIFQYIPLTLKLHDRCKFQKINEDKWTTYHYPEHKLVKILLFCKPYINIFEPDEEFDNLSVSDLSIEKKLIITKDNKPDKEINIEVQYYGDKIVLKQDQFYKVELSLFMMKIDDHTILIERTQKSKCLDIYIYKNKPLTILLNSNYYFTDESVIPNKKIVYHYPENKISKISFSCELYKNEYDKIDDMIDYDFFHIEKKLKITKDIN